ncbi:MAG: hypothetical protein U0R49_12200 [Fimbriimonadales bacterium]
MTTFLFVLVAQGAADAPVTLEWKQEKGATVKHRMVMNCDADFNGTKAKMEVTTGTAKKCVDVGADGSRTVEVRQTELKIVFDGEPIQQPVNDTALTIIYTKLGEPKSFLGTLQPEPSELELSAALRIIFPENPVKKGDSWTFKRSADSASGVAGSETSFVFEGVETLDGKKFNKVTFNHKQTQQGGLTAIGTAWLDPVSGVEQKGEYTVKNVDFGHGLKAAEVKFKLTRLQ